MRWINRIAKIEKLVDVFRKGSKLLALTEVEKEWEGFMV